jgi:hypothetical protein
MFKDYLYVSGTSATLREYFTFFADMTSDLYFYVNSERPKTILDIASNDGSQLDAFKVNGLQTFGVDPAENLATLTQHTTVVDYWTADSANKISSTVPENKFDMITAQNVFAHVHDVTAFLANCKSVMHDKSLLFIQTSQANMIERNEFDTMYFEHLSFFTTNSMYKLAKRCGMVLENVMKTAIHGDSYVFVLSLNGERGIDSSLVSRQIEEERKIGLYKLATYEQFAMNAIKCIADLRTAVVKLRAGNLVYGYGAAAKGMTILNAGNIQLSCIIDDNPLKQGRFAPGVNTPIYGSDYLIEHPANVYVPLAWNFADEIVDRISKITQKRNTYIKYFPSLEITTK